MRGARAAHRTRPAPIVAILERAFEAPIPIEHSDHLPAHAEGPEHRCLFLALARMPGTQRLGFLLRIKAGAQLGLPFRRQ